ncbi:hypothetical protein M513_09449 [Trichuris suis]|uniref:Uncharacterized protein n=1 Tax=Trichuris suis TaxID=68888 RepID=A0A085LXC1_9BILA|nr:hypothetical protein M513_09449 [Trichuris suis]
MITLGPSDILVSYDVKDLFTSIPMDIILNALENLLDKDSTLSQRTSLKAFHVKKLVSFCMKEANYFRVWSRQRLQIGSGILVQEIHERLREPGRFATDPPSSFDNQALKELVESDPTLIQDETAMKLGVIHQTICAHLKPLGKENNKVIVTVITVQPRASANLNFASASPPGASPPRLVDIRVPPDGHLRCAEAHLDSVDDAVVLEDR